MSNTTLARWQILGDPCGAIDNWPELAAECDARWAELDDPTKTVGQRIPELHALAIQIMDVAGVIPPKGDPNG